MKNWKTRPKKWKKASKKLTRNLITNKTNCMNKQLSVLSMILSAIVGIIMLTAFGLQQKGNGKNDKAQQGKGNQKQAGNSGKPDKTVTVLQDKGKGNGNGNGNGNGKNGNNGNQEKGNG